MNALTARLLAGTLLLLGILATTSWLVLTQAAREFSDELTQQLNGSIAMYVAEEAPLIRAGRPDTEQLARLARQAMIINPMAEVYLLDPRGRIIGRRDAGAADAKSGTPIAAAIELAPIRRFLGGGQTGPLYAIDPRDAQRPRVFSAAEVRYLGQLEGYVYVVLGGARAASLGETLRSSYILRAALGTLLAVLALVAIAAWGLTTWLTRPIRALHARALQLGAELDASVSTSDGRRDGTLEAVRRVFEALATRLHTQLTDLRQADRLRRELFTNVSHDLRTPLTAMRGYIDTLALQMDELSPQSRQECIAIASRHCDRLSRLVEQIFSLARLDVGALHLRPEPLSLTELAQDTVRKYQLLAQTARLQLRLAIDPLAPQVSGDIGMLETVLENLLDNAVRHGAPGSEIVVAVQVRGAAVHLQVRDQGSGIEAVNLLRLTQRFETGTGGRTGLGLAIVSRVLALHGSALELSSEPGRGTIAGFCLPSLSRDTAADAASWTPASVALGGVRNS